MEFKSNSETEQFSKSSQLYMLNKKLNELLGSVPIHELPLDYIDTKFFGDLYRFQRVLGAGSFGVIVQVKEIISTKIYAIKLVSKDQIQFNSFDLIVREEEIMAKLSHPNIIQLKKVHQSKEFIFIVMEIAGAGSLESFIEMRRRAGKPLSDAESSCLVRQILLGLQHIHSAGIIHRDIKPQNILMTSFHSLMESVKISDFGLGTIVEDKGGPSDQTGTVIYMAPEQLARQVYHKEVDIWATGLIAYILIEGRHPLYDKSYTQQSFCEKLKHPDIHYSSAFSELAKDFCQRLIQTRPESRYSAEEALQHPWITRAFSASIPLSYYDSLVLQHNKKTFLSVIHVMTFLYQFSSQDTQPKVIEENPNQQFRFRIRTITKTKSGLPVGEDPKRIKPRIKKSSAAVLFSIEDSPEKQMMSRNHVGSALLTDDNIATPRSATSFFSTFMGNFKSQTKRIPRMQICSELKLKEVQKFVNISGMKALKMRRLQMEKNRQGLPPINSNYRLVNKGGLSSRSNKLLLYS